MVVLLNLGNETEKLVIDARLRMSIHVGTLPGERMADGRVVHAHGSCSPALAPSQQLLPYLPFTNRVDILEPSHNYRSSESQAHSL